MDTNSSFTFAWTKSVLPPCSMQLLFFYLCLHDNSSHAHHLTDIHRIHNMHFHASACTCLHSQCLRAGIFNSVNFQVNMIDMVWITERLLTTVGGRMWWQPVFGYWGRIIDSLSDVTLSLSLSWSSSVFSSVRCRFIFSCCEIRSHVFLCPRNSSAEERC